MPIGAIFVRFRSKIYYFFNNIVLRYLEGISFHLTVRLDSFSSLVVVTQFRPLVTSTRNLSRWKWLDRKWYQGKWQVATETDFLLSTPSSTTQSEKEKKTHYASLFDLSLLYYLCRLFNNIKSSLLWEACRSCDNVKKGNKKQFNEGVERNLLSFGVPCN